MKVNRVIKKEEKEKKEEEEFEIEEILKHKFLADLKKAQFLVKWTGYSNRYNKWEPWDNLIDTEALETYIKGLDTKKVRGAKEAKRLLNFLERPKSGVHVYDPNNAKKRRKRPQNWTFGSKKNFTGRKMKVLDQDLKLKGKGGCYCFMPHESVDDNGKALFKIGMTTDFISRFDQYHTSFPEGLYLVAFLVDPKVPDWDDDRKAQWRIENKKGLKKDLIKAIKSEHYKVIEKYLFDYVTSKDGRRLHTTVNVRKPEVVGRKGSTEWFYTDVELIHEAYTMAEKEYGGEKQLFNFEGLNPDTGEQVSINILAERKRMMFPNHTGNITFSV